MYEQMQWLIKEKLAPCLRLKISSETSTPSPPVDSRRENNDVREFQQDGHQQRHDVILDTTDNMPIEIYDFLQTRIRSKAEDSDKDKKNEWKLAAAVIDRILCIIFGILLVGGTIIFFVTFTIAYHTYH